MRRLAFKTLLFLILLSGVLSCSPMIAYIELERKVDTHQELDLSNKKIAALTSRSASIQDSLNITHLYDGITSALEDYYSYSELSIPVFSFESGELASGSTSALLGYSALTSSDVMILIEDCNMGNFEVRAKPEQIYQNGLYYMQKQVSLPYSVKYTIFDADHVKILHAETFTDTLFWNIASEKELSDLAAISRANRHLAESMEESAYNWISSLLPQWVADARVVYVYDSEEWIRAYELSKGFMWKNAIDIWMKLADSQNDRKAACAAFNIAVALEVTGEYDLAVQWLDFSRKRYDLNTQDALRAIIVKDRKESAGK